MASGGIRVVLRVREFRGLEAAALISTLGNQLARVALSVLVFARTGSALLTAVTYAVSFLPALLGGPLLSGLADRAPRRSVMIVCDVGRAILIGTTAVPGTPLAVLLTLLFCVGLLDSPFQSARSGVVRAAIGNDGYSAAASVDQAIDQVGQVLGFGAAGVLVAATSPSAALLADSASFVLSAVLLVLTVAHRPAADAGGSSHPHLLALVGSDAVLGWRTLMGDRLTRRAVLLVWVGLGALTTPEGLAAPWAHHLHGGPRSVGVLLLASPLGTVVGVLVVGIERGRARADPSRLMFALAGVAMLPLVACLADPGLAAAAVLLAVSGLGGGYIVLAQVVVVRRTPDQTLGRVVGVAGTGLTVAKALALVGGGLLGQALSAPLVVSIVGIVSLAGCLAVAIGTRGDRPVAAFP